MGIHRDGVAATPRLRRHGDGVAATPRLRRRGYSEETGRGLRVGSSAAVGRARAEASLGRGPGSRLLRRGRDADSPRETSRRGRDAAIVRGRRVRTYERDRPQVPLLLVGTLRQRHDSKVGKDQARGLQAGARRRAASRTARAVPRHGAGPGRVARKTAARRRRRAGRQSAAGLRGAGRRRAPAAQLFGQSRAVGRGGLGGRSAVGSCRRRLPSVGRRRRPQALPAERRSCPSVLALL